MKNIAMTCGLFLGLTLILTQITDIDAQQKKFKRTAIKQFINDYRNGKKLTEEQVELIKPYMKPRLVKSQPPSLLTQSSSTSTFSEDFSSGALPAGWEIIDHAGAGEVWRFNNPGAVVVNTTTNDNGFAIFDSEDYGDETLAEECDLITPPFDCSGATTVILRFAHYFRAGFDGAAEVSVSGDNGVTWESLDSWTDLSTANAEIAAYDISTTAAGQSQVKIRWKWTGNFSWYWAIDDVVVLEPTVGVLFTSQDSIDFGATDLNTSKSLSVMLTNGGTTLNISSITSDNPDFTVSDVPSSIATAATDSFNITFTPTAEGTSTARITIVHDGENGNTPGFIDVAGLGFSAPQVVIPWLEEFAGADFDPASWDLTSFESFPEVIDENGVSSDPFPFAVPSPPYMMEISGEDDSGNPPDVVVSGIFDLSAESSVLLSFWKSEHDLEFGEYVLISYFTNSGTWKTLDSLAGTNNGFGVYEPFEKVEILLPNDALHPGFQLRFSASANMSSVDEYLFDDIQIFAGFAAPKNLAGHGGDGVVDLAWEPPSGFLAELLRQRGYDGLATRNDGANSRSSNRILFDSPSDFASDVLALLRYRIYRSDDGINFSLIDSVDVPNISYSDNNVSNGITYWYDVTAVYDEGESNPSNTVQVTPLKPPANALLFESFEGSFLPAGWHKLNPDGGTGWNQQAVGTSPIPGWSGGIITGAPSGGNNVAFCTWTTGGDGHNDQWLVTPQITNVQPDDSLHFWLRYWPGDFADEVEVRISTSGNSDPADFDVLVETLEFGDTGIATNTWRRYSYRIDDFASPGSDIYIAFRERVEDNFEEGATISLDLVTYARKLPAISFSASLSGHLQAPAPVNTAGTGGAIFQLSQNETVLNYEIAVRNLSSGITAAHFHNAPAGSNGSVVKTIFDGGLVSRDTTFAGVWTSTDSEPFTAQLLSELRNGNLYINVHTENFPAGEIRGQVLEPRTPRKLLISELVVTPTSGEFIEIYNPNSVTVDLSNYYLTDATFQNGGVYYYQIVIGGGGGGSAADFHARFPAGATISPGEYQTIALNGNIDFEQEYSQLPTYELYEDDALNPSDVPDMLDAFPGSINGQGGLTDSDEGIVLYHWDGISDLVEDVDYVIYADGAGGLDSQVDKTGVSLEGPDINRDPTEYLADTPISSQLFAPAHTSGFSTQRVDFREGVQTVARGNGVTGANETSEDLNNTFVADLAPTPNAGPAFAAGLNPPRSFDADPEDSIVSLSWATPLPAGELGYDDDSWEFGLLFVGGGGEYATRFTPNVYPARLVGIKTLWGDFEDSENTVQYSVWVNPAGGDSPPSSQVLPNTDYAVSNRGDFSVVDISSANITITEGDFFYSWVQIGDEPYDIGHDSDGADAGRSWTSLDDGASWQTINSVGLPGNLMIRALLQVGSGTSAQIVELPPAPRNSVTKTASKSSVSFISPQRTRRGERTIGIKTRQNHHHKKLSATKIDGLNGYELLRSEDRINFTKIATLDSQTTSFFDNNVTNGVTYLYALTAIYDTGVRAALDTIQATPASSAVQLPIAEGFNSGFPELPTGWFQIDLDGGDEVTGKGWNTQSDTVDNVFAFEGDGYSSINFESANAQGVIDEWLITPQLLNYQSGMELSFYLNHLDDVFADSVMVLVSTTDNNTASFTEIDYINSPTVWTEFSYKLENFGVSPGDNIYIAWRYLLFDGGSNGTNGNFVGLDAVSFDFPTSVDEEESHLPTEFGLEQNFPNPFNPSTTLKYALKEDGEVTLNIYNVLGQLIKTLVNEKQNVGFKQVIWDGTNDSGVRVGSGLYIFKLVVNASGGGHDFVESRKMLLLK